MWICEVLINIFYSKQLNEFRFNVTMLSLIRKLFRVVKLITIVICGLNSLIHDPSQKSQKMIKIKVWAFIILIHHVELTIINYWTKHAMVLEWWALLSETLIGFLILLAMIVIVLAVFAVRERMAGRVVVPAVWNARIPALLARV